MFIEIDIVIGIDVGIVIGIVIGIDVDSVMIDKFVYCLFRFVMFDVYFS